MASGRMRRAVRLLGFALAALPLAGCESVGSFFGFGNTGPAIGQPGFVRGFLGGVAAEDPAAAIAARDILSAGGNATDAAVAAGFALAVTLPSRVGLGGGGACMVFDPRKGAAEAILFLPGARQGTPAGADRPAAVPLLARGLFALSTRLPGGRPFEELLIPAEGLARNGTPVSRPLAADLAAVAGPLLADPVARAVFARADGQPRQAGDQLVQLELAATMTQLRLSGVGDLHQGAMARRLETGARLAGGGLTLDELRVALPGTAPPVILPARGGDLVAFLPPPADGGLAAAASFYGLQAGLPPVDAGLRGLAVLGAWRQRGGDPRALLAATDLPPAGGNGFGASSGLVVFDRQGGAAACAFTLNNLFGTGRMVPGMGFLLASAPGLGAVPAAPLAAAIAYNPNVSAFRLAVAGSGQEAAPMAVAGPAAQNLLRGQAPPAAIPAGRVAPGRSQLAACPNYLPGSPERCQIATDPAGNGVALGAIDR